MKVKFNGLFFLICFLPFFKGQQSIWNADNNDGTYTNPIIYSDFSDPDVVKVDGKYYMTASSFNCIPGLPILESYDLVNWKLVNYALQKNVPEEVYAKVQHGNGVWAPCIRFYKNEFYIFYPDPEFGIYYIKAKNPSDKWSEPILIKAGKGLIDPSPFWDDDGTIYLVYAFAGSRAGIKSFLAICTLNSDTLMSNSDDALIIDGHIEEPTIEGPKLYKKKNYYYIFAPAGGVATGWQTVMRSKNIFGPYEKKKVLQQGNTQINGPHQGAWISTDSGEDWFIYFQDVGALGRIVHLQPMSWEKDWPIIGKDDDHDGIGEPVLKHKKPNVGKSYPKISLNDSDEFNSPKLGLQWQWHANPKVYWGFPSALGYYTLNCIPKPESFHNLFDVPNLLLQKIPAPTLTATAKIEFNSNKSNEEAGLVLMGLDYAYLKVKNIEGKNYLSLSICLDADKKSNETESTKIELSGNQIYFQVKIKENNAEFFYSENGKNFIKIGSVFQLKEGKWIGAKLGFVALRDGFTNDAGNLKIDWMRFQK